MNGAWVADVSRFVVLGTASFAITMIQISFASLLPDTEG
jgi:hypothetical protein